MYKQNEKYIAFIDKRASEVYPIIPLAKQTGDNDKDLENLILTIRSSASNIAFIRGYEEALSNIKTLIDLASNNGEEVCLPSIEGLIEDIIDLFEK